MALALERCEVLGRILSKIERVRDRSRTARVRCRLSAIYGEMEEEPVGRKVRWLRSEMHRKSEVPEIQHECASPGHSTKAILCDTAVSRGTRGGSGGVRSGSEDGQCCLMPAHGCSCGWELHRGRRWLCAPQPLAISVTITAGRVTLPGECPAPTYPIVHPVPVQFTRSAIRVQYKRAPSVGWEFPVE